MFARIAHQSEIEGEVVDAGNLHGKEFLGLEQMMEVGLGVDAVHIAAIGIDRTEV